MSRRDGLPKFASSRNMRDGWLGVKYFTRPLSSLGIEFKGLTEEINDFFTNQKSFVVS